MLPGTKIIVNPTIDTDLIFAASDSWKGIRLPNDENKEYTILQTIYLRNKDQKTPVPYLIISGVDLMTQLRYPYPQDLFVAVELPVNNVWFSIINESPDSPTFYGLE